MRISTLVLGCLISSQLLAADPVAGKFWYEQNCARCHGSPPQERQGGTPNITGFPAARIRGALANVVAMTKVNLTAAQVLDVEAYLVAPAQYAWAPGTDFSDLWWNPSEPGWGLTLSQRPSAHTAGTLYLYQADRRAVWLLLSELEWSDPLTLTGKLLRTEANGFPASGFPSATLNVHLAGQIRFRFQDARSGQVEFDIDGVAYSKAIVRTEF